MIQNFKNTAQMSMLSKYVGLIAVRGLGSARFAKALEQFKTKSILI